MVFGGRTSPMSFAGSAGEPVSQPFLRDRSTSVPSGLRFPPSSAAEIRIRQWPPLSIDSQLRSSLVSASERRSCVRWRRLLCGIRADRPGAQPNFSAANSVSPGGSRRTLPQTTARASPHHRISTRGLTSLPLRTDGALASVQETRRHPRCG